MTHEEKLNYMKIACGISGYGLDLKGMDMLISMYELVLSKKGKTALDHIVKVKMDVENREDDRRKAVFSETGELNAE